MIILMAAADSVVAVVEALGNSNVDMEDTNFEIYCGG